MAVSAGYSGTPLAQKLSLKSGMNVQFWMMPDAIYDEIAGAGLGLIVNRAEAGPYDAVHLFTVVRADLVAHLATALRQIRRDGFIWVSWPKKAAKLPTDMTEDVIRAVALPMGLVDVKVCAVDAVWSGLKLMIRKELR